MIHFSRRPPTVSVIMPVYNGGKYLAEAIRSILNQIFIDFEFIIIDDGSTDQTNDVIHSTKDKRIIAIKNETNMGNYPSRNLGMSLARGKYICVMDADDISLPRRLEMQYAYMEKNPETGICGSFIQVIPSGFCPRYVTDEKLLRVVFLSNNFCSHPSLILRKEFLNRNQLMYNLVYQYSADYDLCSRGFRYFKVQNIPVILLQYRHHEEQISTAKYKEQQMYADQIRINQLVDFLKFKTEQIPISLHLSFMKNEPINLEFKEPLRNWIETIITKNRVVKYYDENTLQDYMRSLLNHARFG